MKKSKILIVVSILTFSFIIFTGNFLFNRNWPKRGEIKEVKVSEDGKNIIEIYEQGGNATVGLYTRVYLKDSILNTMDELIYLERKPYRENIVTWKDNNTIIVDGKKLDIHEEKSILDEK